ncbi:MAG: hypothetical protein A2020_15960 [Lentisphaerae bacterium GWF2_45_14]|nr:MAG: hypothetical protein A2020_15960 [Lentisphaerae bacterium GWF2_45_14]
MSQEDREPAVNILIAEDDDAAAHLIKTNLMRAGLDAAYLRAKNGEEVLQLLSGGTIPPLDKLVVLLDIRMPKIDGIRVLREMKESPLLRKIPVIMLTTSDRAQEVDECYRIGCNAYLKKQVDYSRFVDSIKKLASFIQSCEIPVIGDWEDGRKS